MALDVTKVDLPPELAALSDSFDRAEQDARTLVSGITEEIGTWRAQPGSWSVAECLDHLATSNGVYLAAMQPPAERALRQGRMRRRPALPGLLGGMFVRSLEPPVKRRRRAPRKISPRASVPLADAAARFFASQPDIREFLERYAQIDLTGVHFPNPFVWGIRFSLATGIRVLEAHERRHLEQAWHVRQAAARALASR